MLGIGGTLSQGVIPTVILLANCPRHCKPVYYNSIHHIADHI